MGRAAAFQANPGALHAQASMQRILRRLRFETHPILARDVCAFEHDGDLVMLDAEEVQRAADRALTQVIGSDILRFQHLPNIGLDLACRRRLAAAASTLV